MPKREQSGELLIGLIVAGVLALALTFGIIFSIRQGQTATALPAATATTTATERPAAALTDTLPPTAVALATGPASATPTRAAPFATITPIVLFTVITATPTPPATLTAANAPSVAMRPSQTRTATLTHTATPTITRTAAPRTATTAATTTSTRTATASATTTATFTRTATATHTPSLTATRTPTHTSTHTATRTATATASATPTATATATITLTPSDTPPPSLTPTPTLFLPTLPPEISTSIALVPTTVGQPTSFAQPNCAPRRDWVPYVVQPGDTLFSIARAVGLPVSELQAGSCIVDPTRIMAGQVVLVPPGKLVGTPGARLSGPNTEGCDNADVRITAPEPGSTVRGIAQVYGTASLPGLIRFQLTLEPADGSGRETRLTTNTQPVRDGFLGVINTAVFPPGVYWLLLTANAPDLSATCAVRLVLAP
jgi:LysM repeat protein